MVLDLAGPGTRVSSGAIDLLGQLVLAGLGGLALSALSGPIGDDWVAVLAAIGGFALLFVLVLLKIGDDANYEFIYFRF